MVLMHYPIPLAAALWSRIYIGQFTISSTNAKCLILSMLQKCSHPQSQEYSSCTSIHVYLLLQYNLQIPLKIIASRLKVVLPQVISSNQVAFLPSRSILDNVLMTYELLKVYNNTHISPRAMLKLNISKAFDSIQWDSIVRIMSLVNFPKHIVAWIFARISTASYSIIVNGSNVGYFQSKQGIRQGDVMSAYFS